MKIKNGRVKIECEKGRTKFSEVKYGEFLDREEEAKKKAAKKGVKIQVRLHAKTT